MFLNLSTVIRKLRRLLFYGVVFSVIINVLGGLLFGFDSLGSSAAFVVGTAILSAPLWGLQGVLVLFWPRHYTANEWFWSLLAAIYMTFLVVTFFTFAVEFNFA